MCFLHHQTIARGFEQDQMLTWNNFLSVLRMMEMEKDRKEVRQWQTVGVCVEKEVPASVPDF